MATIIKGKFPRPRKGDGASKEKPAPIYQLNISLTYSDPPIWRRFQVPGEFTLAQLHEVINLLMGWSGAEAHQFYVGKIFYEITNVRSPVDESKRFAESKYRLQDLEESMKWCFIYLYDAGEGWEHEIELEEILSVAEGGVNHPVLIGGQRAAPPEDIGDIHIYEQALSDREKNDGDVLTVEIDKNFDPDFLDVAAINGKLMGLVVQK